MGKKPMDPFARRMIQGSFVYGGVMLLMFAVLSAIYLHTRPRCTDRVVADATDPGKRWTATVMERRCGSEAPFFTHVNLRPVGTDLNTGFFSGSATEGEVFLVEQDAASAGVTLHWTSPTALLISCPHCSATLLSKHDRDWGNIVIEYDLPKR
jgi:hypothetical protein